MATTQATNVENDKDISPKIIIIQCALVGLSHTHEGSCLSVLHSTSIPHEHAVAHTRGILPVGPALYTYSAHKHTTSNYLHLQRGWNKRILDLVEQPPRSRPQTHGATSR